MWPEKDWLHFVGDADFLSFGSPQSAGARQPGDLPSTIWLYPWAGDEWPKRLEALGYKRAERLSYMEMAEPKPALKGDGDIRVVDSEEQALTFAGIQDRGFIGPDSPNADWWRAQFRRVAAANFDRPDQTFYIYSESEPMGVLLSVTTGSTTGIYAVATDPQFRNRGASSALLARCCADAAGRRIVLQVAAGSYAERFYSRLGFVELYSMQVWRRQ